MTQVKGLEKTFQDILARREAKSRLRRLTVVPPNSADFSSNSYLSLSTSEDVQREYLQRLQSEVDAATASSSHGQSASLLGSGGSRLLDGNSSLSESLEREIAAFHGAKAGLLFSSGFDANVGLFSSAPQPGDIIVYDELIHASVHDGMRLSRASKRIPFLHNTAYPRETTSGVQAASSTTNLALSSILDTLVRENEGIRSGTRNVFIGVEGVYSMDGDVTPLKEIVECVEKLLPKGNGYIIVDEAHSTGIIGERGRGLVCSLGLEDRVWARLHTFGKAMSCAGGKFKFRAMKCRPFPLILERN